MASRQKFRRENQAEIDAFRKAGRELECCHIIAKSNGGANNQHNYLMAGANFNRMMGNRHDDIMCALAYDCGGIEKVKAAIKASPACGYTERDAMSLVRAGRQQFARMQEIQGKAIDVWDEGEVLQVELYSGYSSNHTGKVCVPYME